MPIASSTSKSVFPLTSTRILIILAAVLFIYIYFPTAPTSDMGESIVEAAQADAGASQQLDFHFEYEVQMGFFAQSEKETDDQTFDFRKSNFGLIERSYDTDASSTESQPWKRFEKFVRSKQDAARDGESFKVLFLGRHGQGWHNVAETKYGTKAWDCYWSALNGADGLVWSDAHLTPLGLEQAGDVHALWTQQLPNGIPPPETYYVSPLSRTIQTADASFANLSLPADKPYAPLIKELLREALGVHTCDRRSTKSEIEKMFDSVPGRGKLTFEPGFSDPDPLWQSDYREPRRTRQYRLEQFLDDVFSSNDGVFLSMTSHSGAIRSILDAVGHREFALETGGVIPVFVRAKRVEERRVAPPKEPSSSPLMCDKPPVGL